MKRIFILLFAALLFALGAVAFASTVPDDTAGIVPTVIFAAFASAFTYLLVKELIVGRKTYAFENNTLKVMRKGSVILEIQKGDIEGLVLGIDALDGKIHYVTFRHAGQKHVVFADGKSDQQFLEFADGIPCERKSNIWYYVLEFFSW